ncbi:hypothetical protein C1637_18600 [Chryseobacterium lactis]|uniref:Uncharacterized protein n=2 Tax=Chryseobacterium lactis TaxID=1241981 RepID=A0A3G6RJM3_CHRLC|nr:hypothetical protein EG342_24110 [Chryseobacterium lactis]AZB05182.1 hypothetical protein EG341_14990 [Chryseobacterium lactis]PNW12164.1 hypothetical protein C1637_18600 [Chryseobacterium lactis]
MALIEEAYEIFEVLGDLAGNKTILSGGEVVGSFVNPGIVAIDGKLYYFEGGSVSSNLYIHTEPIEKVFESQESKVLIEKRTVKFGTGTGSNNYLWSEFVKLSTLKEIQVKLNNMASQPDVNALAQRVAALELKTSPIVNGGVVFVWKKPVSEIPAGWKECQDFRGKTVMGWNPNDNSFSTLGAESGSKTKIITKQNLPDLTTSLSLLNPYEGNIGGGGFDGGNNRWHYSTGTFNPGGTSQPFDVLNPYRIVNFIEPNFQ